MRLPNISHHVESTHDRMPLLCTVKLRLGEYIALLSEELFVTTPKDLAVKADEGLPAIHSGRTGDWWRKTDVEENPAMN